MSEFGEVIAADAVRFVRRLPGPIERVWSYIVDAEKRKRWLCDGETQSQVGGKVDMHFHNASLSEGEDDLPPEKYKKYGEHVYFTGSVTAYEPPRKLSHTWEFGGEATEVTYELAEDGTKVILTLTHRRLATREDILSVSGGWHTHLDILQEVLTGKIPQAFWKRHTRMESEYEKRLAVNI